MGIQRTVFNSLLFTSVFVASCEVRATCNDLNVEPTTPTDRFVVNADRTVSDTRTGLIWMQCSEGKTSTSAACDTGDPQVFTWQQAIARAKQVNLQGFAAANNWRLPNIKELSSIVERACYNPSINEAVFPGTPVIGDSEYWAATYDANRINSTDGSNDYAWHVRFAGVIGKSGTTAGNLKTSLYFVRLVRSPD